METIRALQGLASPLLDQLMLAATQLGSEFSYIALLLVVFLGVDARRGQRLGLALLLSFFLNQHLKALFDTARPFMDDPSVARSQAAVETALGAGFPSGHAQAGATFWGLAAYYVRRPAFTVLAFLLIFLLGFSRLYLGVHYPADVYGGALIGFAVAAGAIGLERFRLRLAAPATFLLGLLLPFAGHLLLPTPESDLLLGATAAFFTGPLLIRHLPASAWWARPTLVLLGLTLVLGFLFGSSLALPEAVKDHPVGGFLRYLVLGYVGTVLAPWLGIRLGLARLDPARGGEAG